MPKPADLVIAFQATSPAEAELIRTLLENNGLVAMIPDRNMPLPGVDLTPFTKAGGAGCDVVVASRDLERAREIIDEARSAGLEEDEETGAEEEEEDEDEEEEDEEVEEEDEGEGEV